MPSSYTSRNRLEKQAAGENNNTWGARLNDNVIEMMDEASDGVAPFTLSGTRTLSANQAASDESRKRVLDVTGGTGGTIIIPNVEKNYLVRNGSSGDVTVSTGSGGAAVVKSGNCQTVFCNGANEVRAAAITNFGSANVTGSGSATFSSFNRPSFGTGYLRGKASGAPETGSHPIFVLQGTPTDTGLNNMYGVGYALSWPTTFLSSFSFSGSGWGLYVAQDGIARVFLDGATGTIHGAAVRVGNLQVLGSQKAGWGMPGGTHSRTTFDPSSVTTAQLAQRVAALITDLSAHGLIGA